MKKIRTVTIVYLSASWLVVTLLPLSGCWQNATDGKPEPPPTTNGAQSVAQIVQRANWLVVPAIIGMALSIGAFVGVPRILQGLVASIFIACAAALGLTLATVRYAGWIAGMSLAGAIGVFIWTFLVRRRATTEMVDTVEVAKQMLPPEKLQEFKQKIKDDIQSKTTTQLVSEVKKDVK